RGCVDADQHLALAGDGLRNLLDVEDLGRPVAILDDGAHQPSSPRRIARTVASGWVRCGECGAPSMVITWSAPSCCSMRGTRESGMNPPVSHSPRMSQMSLASAFGVRSAAIP